MSLSRFQKDSAVSLIQKLAGDIPVREKHEVVIIKDDPTAQPETNHRKKTGEPPDGDFEKDDRPDHFSGYGSTAESLAS